MRRRLNVNLLLALLAVAGLVGGGVYWLHGLQEKRNAGALLKRADRAEKAGKLDEAERHLSGYLAYRPDDTETLARYGLMLARRTAETGLGRVRALLVLERVLLRAPERNDIRRKAVELAMASELGRFKEASVDLRILLKAQPDDGELELWLGECHEALARTGKQTAGAAEYRQARALYEKAIRHAPRQVAGYVRLAALLRGPLADPDRADQIMDAREVKNGLVASNPESFAAFLERAKYRKQWGFPGAGDDVARAQQLAPDDAEVLLAAAELARADGNFDKMRLLYERGIRCHPKDVRFYEALAVVEKNAGRPTEGLAVLRRGLLAVPDWADLQWGVADLLIQAGKLDEATEAIEQLRRQKAMRPEMLDYLDGRVAASRGRWAVAIPRLEKARALLAGNPAFADLTMQSDLLLARGYEWLATPEQQLAACSRALALDPNWSPALLEQAQALEVLGRPDESIEAYRKLLPRVPAAVGPLTRLLIARNLRKAAGERDWSEVQTLLEQAERASPDVLETPLLWAELLGAKGDAAAARAPLEEARRKFPKRVEPWTALADLERREGRPEETLAVLDEAQRQLGDRVELRIARAGYWAQHRGNDARKALADLAKDVAKFPLEEQIRLKDALANAYSRLGDLPMAERLLDELADKRADDPQFVVRLFDLLVQDVGNADRLTAMDRAITRLRQVEGETGVRWRYGEATRLLLLARRGDKKRLGEARALLTEVAARRPAWGRVPLLEARIAEFEQNPARAIDGYLKAIEAGEREPETIRRAIQLLNEKRRTAEADRLILGLVAEAPPTGVLAKLAVEAMLRQGDLPGALKLARQAVRADSKDYRDHLWLGRVLRVTRPPNVETEGEFHRAVELAENDPETWLAWVSYLAASGQKARAEQAIEEARRKLPPAVAPIVLARCLEYVGSRDKAEDQYRAALTARPDDTATLAVVGAFYAAGGKPEQAQPLFRKILDPRLKAPPGAVAAARRNLALSLASSADSQAFVEAIALIEQNLRDQNGLLEDQRLKALIQASRPGRRREAIAAFEALARQSPPSPEEKYLLAQLYLSVRDTDKARGLLLGLAADDSRNVRYMAALVRVLLTRGEVAEAQEWVTKVAQAAPLSFTALELKARLLQKVGRGSEAVAALEARARSEPNDDGPAAALLEEFGEPTAAERLLREAVARSKNPQANLVLARFLARQGRAGEALELCENAWKTCPAEAVSRTCLVVLDTAKAGDDQRRRVVGWLEEAIRKAPNNIILLMDLANLLIFRGDYPGAEARLRRIIALKPGSTESLNNLAWLLAVRGEKLDEALNLVNRAIALEGSAPRLLDTRGLVYLALGRSAPALKDLTEAVALNPTPTLDFHLARAQMLADRRDAARASLRRAQVAGLDENAVDPLERKALQTLVASLEKK
jgi:tetratricopeptide (TPR) repeat protein